MGASLVLMRASYLHCTKKVPSLRPHSEWAEVEVRSLETSDNGAVSCPNRFYSLSESSQVGQVPPDYRPFRAKIPCVASGMLETQALTRDCSSSVTWPILTNCGVGKAPQP